MKASIISKEVIREPDYETVPDWLGSFSNEAGEFAIHHSDDPRKLKYFNAENVENMEEAEANYVEYMEYETGERSLVHVFARAVIEFDYENGTTTKRSIETGGIWACDPEDEGDHGQLEVLEDMLKALKNLNI